MEKLPQTFSSSADGARFSHQVRLSLLSLEKSYMFCKWGSENSNKGFFSLGSCCSSGCSTVAGSAETATATEVRDFSWWSHCHEFSTSQPGWITKWSELECHESPGTQPNYTTQCCKPQCGWYPNPFDTRLGNTYAPDAKASGSSCPWTLTWGDYGPRRIGAICEDVQATSDQTGLYAGGCRSGHGEVVRQWLLPDHNIAFRSPQSELQEHVQAETIAPEVAGGRW